MLVIAGEENEDDDLGEKRTRSAFHASMDTPKGGPETPATPATPAMTRALLQEMGSYNKNRIRKDPIAKEHLSDAMDLLESGLEEWPPGAGQAQGGRRTPRVA